MKGGIFDCGEFKIWVFNSTGTLLMVCGIGAGYRSTDHGKSWWGHVIGHGTTCLGCATSKDIAKPWHSGPCPHPPFAFPPHDGPRCHGDVETNGAFFELPAANASVNASIFSGARNTLIRSTDDGVSFHPYAEAELGGFADGDWFYGQSYMFRTGPKTLINAPRIGVCDGRDCTCAPKSGFTGKTPPKVCQYDEGDGSQLFRSTDLGLSWRCISAAAGG